MSDACGCGSDERSDDEHEPERLWEITELRAAAVPVAMPADRVTDLAATLAAAEAATTAPWARSCSASATARESE